MNNVYIALGSNLNNPLAQLTQAVQTLKQHPDLKVKKVSPFYGSKPLGPQDQPDYVNAVVQIETDLEPLALLDTLQSMKIVKVGSDYAAGESVHLIWIFYCLIKTLFHILV